MDENKFISKLKFYADSGYDVIEFTPDQLEIESNLIISDCQECIRNDQEVENMMYDYIHRSVESFCPKYMKNKLSKYFIYDRAQLIEDLQQEAIEYQEEYYNNYLKEQKEKYNERN